MFTILVNNILPVFSVLALGFFLGKPGIISRQEAATLNRFAFLVLQPTLIFLLLSQVDLASFQYLTILSYGIGQVIVFTLAFLICRIFLKHDVLESWLLAMATIFVNTLLYIWPISKLIYGDTGNIPIVAIVAWDSAIVFAFFIISTDLIANKSSSARLSLKRITKQPILYAIVMALLFNISGLETPQPVKTGFTFLGAATAPITLFAMGVTLSGQSLIPSRTVFLVSVIKLFGLPLMMFGLLQIGERPQEWTDLVILNAAGPAGAMAFALAMLNNVDTSRIAPVIIWTSFLSLFTLAWLA